MKKLEADFHIATPCFLGGAAENVELRVPSIKGALRFWWRALSYARYEGCIGRLSKEEQRLFGSSEKGQSRFLMRLVTKSDLGEYTIKKDAVLRHRNNKVVGEGVRYLGYGLMKAFGKNEGKLERPCLWRNDGIDFSLQFIARDSDVLKDIEPAVKMLGLLGSVGSRSRKGFGSLTLVQLTGDDVACWRSPGNIREYSDTLQTLLKDSGDWTGEPKISAFSSQSRIDCLMEGNNPLDLLNDYGKAMVRYRSWGKDGFILNRKEKSERRFERDHDWFKGSLQPPDTKFHPRRAVFGLPHDYYSPDKDKAKVKPQSYERRASPLFFHVHRYGERQYVGIALLMRSQFLPDGEQIRVRDKSVPAKPDWSVLTGFLDKEEYFKDRSTLWPSPSSQRSGV